MHFSGDSGAYGRPSFLQDKQFMEYKLYSANVTYIETYCIKELTFDLGLLFIVAKISKDILEAIFLKGLTYLLIV